jgi:sugar-phosphatase
LINWSIMSTFTKNSGESVDKTGEVIAQLLKDAQQSVASGDGSGALQKALLAMRLNTKGDEGEMMKILEQAKGSALKAREEAMKDFGLTSEVEAAKVASRAAMEVVGMTPADDTVKKPKKKKKKKKKSKGKKVSDEAVTNEVVAAQKTAGTEDAAPPLAEHPCQAVVFDMDGLMIDSEPLWHIAERECFLRAAGIQLSDQDLLDTTGLRVDEVVEFNFKKFKKPLGGALKERTVEQIVSRMEQLLVERGSSIKKPGLDAVLAFFKTKHVPLAVASSSPMRLIRAGLTGLGLMDKQSNISSTFSVIVSAEVERLGKPHPGVYLSAAAKLGVPPAACLALEDSLNGVLAAKSARMRCIAVPEDFDNRSLAFHVANAQMRSLEDMDEAVWNEVWGIASRREKRFDESDDEWEAPFADVEDEGGNVPFSYGTLSEVSSHVRTTASTVRKMISFLNLSKDDIFVDLGCGVGAVTNTVGRDIPGIEALGIDFCENELVEARKGAVGLPRVSYECADMFDLPNILKNRCYDLSKVVIYMYLIPKQIGRKELREMCEALMAKGVRVVTFTYHPPYWTPVAEDDTYDLRLHVSK